MAELTNEAKAAIKTEIQAILFDHQKILSELNIYRWIIRFGFVVVLGGSVVGALQIPKYIDSIVTDRVSKFDHLMLAASLSTASQYYLALGELDTFIDEYYKYRTANATPSSGMKTAAGLKISEYLADSQRDFLFRTTLEILSGIDIQSHSGEFIGKTYWESLMTDPYFQRNLSIGKWENDFQINNRIAQLYLKYSSENQAFVQGRIFYTRSLSASKRANEKAGNHYGLALIDLAQNHIEDAAQHFASANQLSTGYATYDNNFRENVDFKMIARWISGDDIQKRYDDTFTRLSEIQVKAAIDKGLMQAKDANVDLNPIELRESARASFLKLLDIYRGANAEVLSDVAAPQIIASLTDSQDKKSAARQEHHIILNKVKFVEISEVNVTETDVRVAVRIVSDQVNYIADPNGKPLLGESTSMTVKTDFLTFSRRRNDDESAWRITHIQGL